MHSTFIPFITYYYCTILSSTIQNSNALYIDIYKIQMRHERNNLHVRDARGITTAMRRQRASATSCHRFSTSRSSFPVACSANRAARISPTRDDAEYNTRGNTLQYTAGEYTRSFISHPCLLFRKNRALQIPLLSLSLFLSTAGFFFRNFFRLATYSYTHTQARRR